MENTLKQIKNNLAKLKKNEDNVPKELLLGKYRKAYEELKELIRKDAEDYLHRMIFEGRMFLKGDHDRIMTYTRQCCAYYQDDRKKNGKDSFSGWMTRALFRNKNVHDFMDACDGFKEAVEPYYLVYWNSKSYIREGWIYNEIIDMIWIGNCWYDWKTYPERIGLYYTYPPSDELLKIPHKNADGEMITC